MPWTVAKFQRLGEPEVFSRLVAAGEPGYEWPMQAVTLKAHYDGKHILLDEPCSMEPNTRLLVTVISGESFAEERQAWLALSQAGLARAYDENEPDYSTAIMRETTPGR